MTTKSTMVMWNHLQYIDQVRAMDKIADLIEEQSDETMRVALAAALAELEIWSNTPIDIVNSIVHDEPEEDDDDEGEGWLH